MTFQDAGDDRERLDLAVDALLENAVKFTSPGDLIEVSVTSDLAGGVRLGVSDTDQHRNGSRGLAGRIVALGYHGHDAVVHVEPEQQAGAAAIIVRTLGGCELPAGAKVTLRARGPVPAWPRARVA